MCSTYSLSFSFFFNDTPTTEIYTLSLHDALPILGGGLAGLGGGLAIQMVGIDPTFALSYLVYVLIVVAVGEGERSEEHTSELQSRRDLVCRLLLEKKKKKITTTTVFNPPHVFKIT